MNVKNTIENNISLEFIQSIKAYLERDIIKTYYIYNFWIVGKNEFIVYEILTTGSLSKPSLLLIQNIQRNSYKKVYLTQYECQKLRFQQYYCFSIYNGFMIDIQQGIKIKNITQRQYYGICSANQTYLFVAWRAYSNVIDLFNDPYSQTILKKIEIKYMLTKTPFIEHFCDHKFYLTITNLCQNKIIIYNTQNRKPICFTQIMRNPNLAKINQFLINSDNKIYQFLNKMKLIVKSFEQIQDYNEHVQDVNEKKFIILNNQLQFLKNRKDDIYCLSNKIDSFEIIPSIPSVDEKQILTKQLNKQYNFIYYNYDLIYLYQNENGIIDIYKIM